MPFGVDVRSFTEAPLAYLTAPVADSAQPANVWPVLVKPFEVRFTDIPWGTV